MAHRSHVGVEQGNLTCNSQCAKKGDMAIPQNVFACRVCQEKHPLLSKMYPQIPHRCYKSGTPYIRVRAASQSASPARHTPDLWRWASNDKAKLEQPTAGAETVATTYIQRSQHTTTTRLRTKETRQNTIQHQHHRVTSKIKTPTFKLPLHFRAHARAHTRAQNEGCPHGAPCNNVDDVRRCLKKRLAGG